MQTIKLKTSSSAEKRRPSIFWLLGGILVPLWALCAKYRITPQSRLPKEGPFILAPNHLSEADPIAMAVAVWKLGRLPRFMAKASLFKVPVLGLIMRLSGQIPVERREFNDTKNKTAVGATQTNLDGPMVAANALIDKQAGVIVYPEGTLTKEPDMWPMRGKTGAVRLAIAGKIPLYPAAHWGVQEIMGRYDKKLKLFRRKQVLVAVGEPLDLSEYYDKPLTSAALAEAADKLMTAITDLLVKLRAEQAPQKLFDPKRQNSQ